MFRSTNYMYDYNNVLIVPKSTNINSRNDVNLERNIKFNNNIKWNGIPLMSSNMDTIGVYEVYKKMSTLKMITVFHKFHTLEDYRNMNDLNPDYFMVSSGISNNDYENLKTILDNIQCKWICIDVANGYMESFVNFCKKVKNDYPNHILVAGNVVTKEQVNKLIHESNVDVIKVGIGSGSACLTRKKAGVGFPQLSAVIECSKEAHKYNKYIIADGGITCPGDAAKAYCAGADFVMLGGELSGHDENPGQVREENGKKYKIFYGMSSQKAMETHYGKMNSYRSSEGRELKVKYKGSIDTTLLDYLGGIRSCCAYINVNNIKNMKNEGEFVLVNQQLNTYLVN